MNPTRPAAPGSGPMVVAARIVLIALVALGVALAEGDAVGTAWYVSYGAIGTLLAIRRPRNPIGWILIAIGSILAMQTDNTADVTAVAAGTAAPVTTFLVWLGVWSGATVYVGYLALAIVFPTGQLPLGRWRRPAIAALGLAVIAIAFIAFAPVISAATTTIANPVDLLGWLPLPDDVYLVAPYPILLALIVAGFVSQVVRFRHASGVLRQQLRWLVSAVALVVVGLGVGLVGSAAADGADGSQWLLVVVAYPLIPVAIGIAVLRYRLYAIDRIVSRGIAYGLVTAILGTTFVAIVLALQGLLAPFTQQQTIAVAASTLAVFALFQPLRRRVQAAVDRRFDRTRYDADLTVRSFATRLRGDLDLSTVRGEIVESASAAVRPTTAGVWLRGGAK